MIKIIHISIVTSKKSNSVEKIECVYFSYSVKIHLKEGTV